MQAVWRSERGTGSAENEDRVLVEEKLRLFVVADGLGGYVGGATASAIAVNCIGDFYKTESHKFPDLEALVISSIAYAHSAIRTAASERNVLKRMATTVVVTAVRDNALVIANVGDSRAYLLKYGRLRRVTTDHSATVDLIDKDLPYKGDERSHRFRNMLTRALGSSLNAEPTVFRSTVNDFDQILLCTDGLWSVLSDDLLERTLTQSGNPSEQCRNLVHLAMQYGSMDDMTCVIVNNLHDLGEAVNQRKASSSILKG